MVQTDVLIIGSGPAGYTAGLYTTRAGLDTLLYTGKAVGGQLMSTHAVENFPGFEKIAGADLMDILKKQIQNIGTRIRHEQIIRLNTEVYPFEFETETGALGTAKAVILATGAKAKWLNVSGEERYKGNGISICATCDGFFYRNKTVAVIGGGNTALYEALFLSKVAAKVYLINRTDTFAGEHLLRTQVQNEPKIEIMYNTVVHSFDGKQELERLIVQNTATYQKKQIAVQGVFEAVGTEPDTALITHQLELSDSGYIVTNKRTMETSVPGIFACGDVQEDVYRQAIIAAGSGCIAALSAEKFIFRHRGMP